MEEYETIQKDNKTLKIYYDESPDSPREWDNLGRIICFHNKYNLGDKTDLESGDFNGWEDLKKSLNAVVILPLYLYDHSGITIKTSPFGCLWDSGQVGFIYVTKEDILKEYKENTPKIKKIVLNILENEIKNYNDFLTGQVFSFELYENKKVKIIKQYEGSKKTIENTTESVLKDSCGGFFGEEGLKQIKEENDF